MNSSDTVNSPDTMNPPRHEHGHGHEHDRGWRGLARYLVFAPRMWRSAFNRAAVDHLAPRPGERIVDIGAGMGAGTTLLADHGAHVLALEPTPSMRAILRVRRHLHTADVPIRVVDAGAESIPAPDATVDAVLAVNSMHHWTEPDLAAGEIVRILRPGGRVLLVDQAFDHDDHDRGRIATALAPEFEPIDAELMAARLRDAGLDEVDANLQVLGGQSVHAVTGRRGTDG